jgi:hypothetical protein
MTTVFYDSTTPGHIPAGADACLYRDGKYAATKAEAARFGRVHWITITGDPSCGIVDYEPGNPVYTEPGKLREYVEARHAAGHRARVYTDRYDLPKVRQLLIGLSYLVWVSTLDGNKLHADWATGLWAVQYAGGPHAPFDESVLYGTW